jgi:hypothetical protein
MVGTIIMIRVIKDKKVIYQSKTDLQDFTYKFFKNIKRFNLRVIDRLTYKLNNDYLEVFIVENK